MQDCRRILRPTPYQPATQTEQKEGKEQDQSFSYMSGSLTLNQIQEEIRQRRSSTTAENVAIGMDTGLVFCTSAGTRKRFLQSIVVGDAVTSTQDIQVAASLTNFGILLSSKLYHMVPKASHNFRVAVGTDVDAQSPNSPDPLYTVLPKGSDGRFAPLRTA
eukprot:NODE_375_length_1570_cov_95.926542_g343_i0.p2 GENE.NODE_375_length_1570_cov_95.926542_g343_i0~~NODE_375_length_1570_cov_95.926542_g343_i0.p2  ORF type:complete len:161 (-),score=23.77 NODE_375_length_1570_cov_95.926542_g343_i0:47-529(-)